MLGTWVMGRRGSSVGVPSSMWWWWWWWWGRGWGRGRGWELPSLHDAGRWGARGACRWWGPVGRGPGNGCRLGRGLWGSGGRLLGRNRDVRQVGRGPIRLIERLQRLGLLLCKIGVVPRLVPCANEGIEEQTLRKRSFLFLSPSRTNLQQFQLYRNRQ